MIVNMHVTIKNTGRMECVENVKKIKEDELWFMLVTTDEKCIYYSKKTHKITSIEW